MTKCSPARVRRKFLKRHTKMLRDLDIVAGRQWLIDCKTPGAENADEKVILAGIHKARLHAPGFSESERVTSSIWLEDNNFTEATMPLTPEILKAAEEAMNK